MDVIARTTLASPLKVSLDQSTARARSIADRIARAGAAPFVLPDPTGVAVPAVPATVEPVDLEAEMTRLADEQLRFDAAAQLLRKTYAGLRASLRDR